MQNENEEIIKYKTSKYNYLIDYNDRKLLFNGLTGNGFNMNSEEYDNLHSLLLDLDSFQKKYPDDFSRLHKLGYIIENDFDEIEFIKFKNREQVFLNKSYRLFINPTLECNFNCWYCYEEHPKGYMTVETMEKIKKHLTKKILDKEITALNLSWFGGEPLLYFYEVILPLTEFSKKICEDNNVSFMSSITTNAFLIDEKMISFFSSIELKTFQITLDGGRDRHNKIRNQNGEPSYDIIINNINLLCENIEDVHITLRINYDNQTLKQEDINDILTDIKEANRAKIRVDMQRVWQTNNTERSNTKNEDLLRFMNSVKKMGYKHTTYGGGLSIGTFHTCYVSQYQHLEINYDGKIYKCTARDYTEKYVVGEMLEDGTIKWDYAKISKLYASPAFDNPICIKCEYLPICYGPCPQKNIETPIDKIGQICALKKSEQPIKNMIINYYEQSIKNKK